jgi:hypothetical protein
MKKVEKVFGMKKRLAVRGDGRARLPHISASLRVERAASMSGRFPRAQCGGIARENQLLIPSFTGGKSGS